MTALPKSSLDAEKPGGRSAKPTNWTPCSAALFVRPRGQLPWRTLLLTVDRTRLR